MCLPQVPQGNGRRERPLVSLELVVDWMAKYDNQTVPVQDVANQIANITEWQQELSGLVEISQFFTGEDTTPLTGSEVKASELVTALKRKLGTDAKTTAAQSDRREQNFWIPFAAKALAEQINRNSAKAFQQMELSIPPADGYNDQDAQGLIHN